MPLAIIGFCSVVSKKSKQFLFRGYSSCSWLFWSLDPAFPMDFNIFKKGQHGQPMSQLSRSSSWPVCHCWVLRLQRSLAPWTWWTRRPRSETTWNETCSAGCTRPKCPVNSTSALAGIETVSRMISNGFDISFDVLLGIRHCCFLLTEMCSQSNWI